MFCGYCQGYSYYYDRDDGMFYVIKEYIEKDAFITAVDVMFDRAVHGYLFE